MFGDVPALSRERLEAVGQEARQRDRDRGRLQGRAGPQGQGHPQQAHTAEVQAAGREVQRAQDRQRGGPQAVHRARL